MLWRNTGSISTLCKQKQRRNTGLMEEVFHADTSVNSSKKSLFSLSLRHADRRAFQTNDLWLQSTMNTGCMIVIQCDDTRIMDMI